MFDRKLLKRNSARSAGSVSRSVMAAALALGMAGGATAVPTPAFAAKPKAPKLKLSAGFQKIVIDAQKAVEGAKSGGDPVAAKAKLDEAIAAVSTEDDKYMAGNLAIGLGSTLKDAGLQRRGIQMMLESGKVPAEEQGRFNFFAGQLAYQAQDYASARTSLQEAIRLGFREGDPEVMLAEAMVADNQVAQGLAMLSQAIETRKASGQLAPENWYRRGLGVAYNAKALNEAGTFARALARDYPSQQNWAGAITVVREVGKFNDQEVLDLMRLMDVTNSYAEKNDYLEYIQTADARRLPGEVLRVIQAGIASGKVPASDSFAADAKAIASGRLAADKASLGGLERDARAANASAATVVGAGDAFLSYDEPAKAVEFYTSALSKPGIDQPRVLTRLGIAQVKAGQNAAAQQTLAKVTGQRKPIADLWSIYAGQKAGPVAAAVPAS